MKTVYDLVKQERATIKKLHATGDLKSRLLSLGFHKGAEISVTECTPSKQTIQVNVESMKLAIRMNEAKEIEVYE
jgi:ferrous iron transport protein A